MKLIFSYGKKVEPNLDKLKAFSSIAKEFGIQTQNVEYDFDQPADERAEKLLGVVKEAARSGEKLLLAGTSMGCYGSLLATREVAVAGCFLVSPALFMDAYAVKDYPLQGAGLVQMAIGWDDTVIPVDKVLAFAGEHKIETHLVKDTHPMPDSLEVLKALFRVFLEKVTA